MKKEINLNTERLRLRTLKVEDINDDYIDALNDSEVNRFLVNVRLRKQTYKTVKDFIEKNLQSSQDLLLGIFTKKENKFIGTVRIHDISNFHYFCSLGICLFDKRHWKKGHALEALKKTVNFIFKELGLHYIEAGVYKGNKTSLKLFQRAGFKNMAYFKDKFRYNDDFREVSILGLKNPDFNFALLN